MLSTGEIAIALADLAPDTTEPTTTNSKWWVGGGTTVEANKPLTGSEANLTSLEVDGTLYSLNVSEESAFKLTPISRSDVFTSGTSFQTLVEFGQDAGGRGLRAEDCDDVMLFEFNYTRSNADLNMSTLVRKSEIPVLTEVNPATGALRLQLQGSGGDYMEVFFFMSSTATVMRVREESGNITAFITTVFNVAGAKGETGPAGPAPTAENVYPPAKKIVKAGANIEVTANDTTEQLVISARLPDEAAPRVYALDSRDVRRVAPPYSYHTITEGFNLNAGSAHNIVGPVSTFDYDRTKPGFAVDTNNGRRNSNGVDFTLANSGTTTRTIDVGVGITMANERQYGSNETLTLKVFTYGYAKPGPHPEGYLTHTKVFHFTGWVSGRVLLHVPVDVFSGSSCW